MHKDQLLTEEEAYEMYDDALNVQGRITIGNLSFLPSDILRELDPIAYRVGFNDYCDLLISEDEYKLEWL